MINLKKLPLTHLETIINLDDTHDTHTSTTNHTPETSTQAGSRGQSALAQHQSRGSDRSYHTSNQATRKGQSVMYTILNNGTAVINCDDLQTAIRFVQSLESGLNRMRDHSPFTIVRAEHAPATPDAHVSRSELYATQ